MQIFLFLPSSPLRRQHTITQLNMMRKNPTRDETVGRRERKKCIGKLHLKIRLFHLIFREMHTHTHRPGLDLLDPAAAATVPQASNLLPPDHSRTGSRVMVELWQIFLPCLPEREVDL